MRRDMKGRACGSGGEGALRVGGGFGFVQEQRGGYVPKASEVDLFRFSLWVQDWGGRCEMSWR